MDDSARNSRGRFASREDQRDMDNICALIVDDSSVMRKIVERSLRQAGLSIAQIMEAGNGAEALAAVQKNQVDLILCDINMPVMDGLEFVKQLAAMESAKTIPVVMITTEGSEGHVVQALSAGAEGYIRKPFTPTRSRSTCFPCWQANTMNSSNSTLVPLNGRECWVPTLQLAMQEVFRTHAGLPARSPCGTPSPRRASTSPPWSGWRASCVES